jgi:hypothetical protein
MLGCGASGKTYSMATYALCDWFAMPDDTLWLISSTEYRGADLRIWGDIQLLFNKARQLHDWLPGTPLLSLHAIVNEEDDTEDSDDFVKAARSLKRGLIVVPNKKGNVSIGLSPFIGVRVPRLRHAGDEISMMSPGFSDAYANWYGNSEFRGIMGANPIDITDHACTLAEPKDGGWDHFVDTEKTQEWTAKFYNAHVIAFDGRDSPNFDYADADTNPKYRYLVGPKKIKAVIETFGKDSWQYYSQCVGKPNKTGLTNRIVTRQLCESCRALEEVIWLGGETTSVYGLDPSYGGQDKCIGQWIEFGEDVDHNHVMVFHPPDLIPVKPVIRKFDKEPEEQIAIFVKNRIAQIAIPPENVFYDATGKGTLGMAFAQVFGVNAPKAIDSGAKATARPVRADLYVEDESGNGKRLKRCDEAYMNWLTEGWFSVAEAIRSKQVRHLPSEVMKELCIRMYLPASGGRLQIEPKSGSAHRPGFIQRVGYSPNYADAAVMAVEGCRQRGFSIKRIGIEIKSAANGVDNWMIDEEKELESILNKHTLNHAS